MRKPIFLSSLLIFCLLFLASYCYAQPLSARELIENAEKYDGQTVIYEGEAIGDVMCRGDFCWVNINDGHAAIGAWMKRQLAEIINYTGSYKAKGDRLMLSGIFNRACNQHRGELDLHVQEMQVIEHGQAAKRGLDFKKRNLAIFLFAILCIIWILSRLRKI